MRAASSTDGDRHAAEGDAEVEPTVVSGRSTRQFGRYQLCFEIASGGMATVYLARSEGAAGVEKVVAIKRIHPHLTKQKSFVEMFLDEARIASQINHPNVCSVYEFGDVDGTYYIAMEYLHGESFWRVLRAMRKEADRGNIRQLAFVARIVADACEGLHAAHELKDRNGDPLHVVHRDVSPQNLYVTYDGGVRVVDFGIASAANRVHHTATGTVKGKFAYMAPEQLRGHAVDRRADVWALGVVLWELATQQRLFRRNTESETMLAVMMEPIRVPSAVNPRVPKTLEAIIMKALERNPDRRYASARDLGRDLIRFLGETGYAFGLADLAEWMDDLFPEAKAKKGQLLDLARQSFEVPQVQTETSGTSKSVAPQRTTVRRRSNRASIAAALALALVGAGVGLGVGLGLHDGGEEDTVAAQPIMAASPRVASAEETPLSGTRSVEQAGAPVPSPPAAVERPTQPAPAAEAATPPAPIATGEEGAPLTDDESRRGRARARARTTTSREPHAPSEPAAPPRDQRTEERAQPSAAAGPGRVSVVTPGGWGDVYAGGRLLGQTPLRVELPAGRHVLDIRPFGRTPGRRVPVVVRAGETERVSVAATP